MTYEGDVTVPREISDLIDSMNQSQSPVFAIANVDNKNGGILSVGEMYSVHAGISQIVPIGFRAEQLKIGLQDLIKGSTVNVLLIDNDKIDVTPDWDKLLNCLPLTREAKLIEFDFRVIAPGEMTLYIDFLHGKRLIATISFTFQCLSHRSQFSDTDFGV